MSPPVDRWLRDRFDDTPEEFLPWLDRPEGEDGDALHRVLEARGLAALSDALAQPGRNRESAFRLLAADAYLTFACEAILDLPDPESALTDLLHRVTSGDE